MVAEPSPHADPSTHPDPVSNPIESALADLLAAPFDKVSITMPTALKSRITHRVAQSPDANFSSYVTEVLAREERRRALVEFLDYMDDLYGPPSAEDIAEADRRWEKMWEKYESLEVSS